MHFLYKTKGWDSLSHVFNILNEKYTYVVMRNYENLLIEGLPSLEHDDVDLLCQNSKEIIEALGLSPMNIITGHANHYYLHLEGIQCIVGLRELGDYYYPTNWESHMLKNRVVFNNSFYVMNDEDYFYSLLYHALLHKKTIADDYYGKINSLSKKLGLSIDKSDYKTVLIKYLKEHGYSVPCPRDGSIPFNFDNVPDELIKGKIRWNIQQLQRIPIRGASSPQIHLQNI